jgi:hypothetical protein
LLSEGVFAPQRDEGQASAVAKTAEFHAQFCPTQVMPFVVYLGHPAEAGGNSKRKRRRIDSPRQSQPSFPQAESG